MIAKYIALNIQKVVNHTPAALPGHSCPDDATTTGVEASGGQPLVRGGHAPLQTHPLGAGTTPSPSHTRRLQTGWNDRGGGEILASVAHQLSSAT